MSLAEYILEILGINDKKGQRLNIKNKKNKKQNLKFKFTWILLKNNLLASWKKYLIGIFLSDLIKFNAAIEDMNIAK